MAQAETVEAPAEEQPRTPSIIEREVEFESEGVRISATVWEPERAPIPEPPPGKDGKPGKPKKIKEGDPEAPPRAYCILVHGLLSDRREWGGLGRRLAEAGFGALALDIKGHGRSDGPRGVISGLDSMVADIRAALTFLKGREEQWDLNPQQFAVIGHSLGAVAALRAGYYLHQESEVVAIAPPRTIKEEIGFLKHLGYWFAYRARARDVAEGEVGPTVPYDIKYTDIIGDAECRRRAKSTGFLQTRMPLQNYECLMGFNAEDIARQVLDPTVTIVAASRDKVISKEATRAIYEAVPSSKRWKLVEGSGHSILLDAYAEPFTQWLIDYLRPRLSAFPEVRPGHTKR